MGYLIALLVAIVVGLHLSRDTDIVLSFLPYEMEDAVKAYKDQVVWITGASSGIGAQLARDYAAAGAQVVISARRADALNEVGRECALVGKQPLILPLDVTDYDAQKEAVGTITEQYGHIDTLVLNAGRSQRGLALETDLEHTRTLMELNVMSYVALTKEVGPMMVKRGKGDIVVVGSVAGKTPSPLQSTYSATKFALQGYFNVLRSEISQYGVNVLIVCPGPVKSEIVQHAIRAEGESVSGKEVYEQDEKIMPTERCTHLILKALYWGYDEVWISDQPILAVTYLAEYTPDLMRWLMKKVIGPSRIKAFKDGGSVFDIKAMVMDLFSSKK